MNFQHFTNYFQSFQTPLLKAINFNFHSNLNCGFPGFFLTRISLVLSIKPLLCILKYIATCFFIIFYIQNEAKHRTQKNLGSFCSARQNKINTCMAVPRTTNKQERDDMQWKFKCVFEIIVKSFSFVFAVDLLYDLGKYVCIFFFCFVLNGIYINCVLGIWKSWQDGREYLLS